MSRLGENSFDGNLLEKLLNDRVLGRYVATVGYSALSSVQECLRYKNGISRYCGQEMPLSAALTTRNCLTPGVTLKARRGFRA
jgi:hypothetical protein